MSSLLRKLLRKIDEIDPWQLACIFAAAGLATYFLGLHNPFENDDTTQIVTNLSVHSISNIAQFFQASTFWDGQHLSGLYYRPLMTTTFSLIYTIFGATPIVFHVVQLAIYTASSFILFLVFKRFLKPAISFLLALIFLVHPLNSQVVYSIPTMQDTLFFFFGILSIWIIIYKERTTRYLLYAAACLFLALLSKEEGIVFVVIAASYLFLFDRGRLRSFLYIMALPLIAYAALRIHAVGVFHAQHAAPIDGASLMTRLLMVPSVLLFYFAKLVFPWKLATEYYWTYQNFSIAHVLAPLLADLAIIGTFILMGIYVHHKGAKNVTRAYIFFGIWAVICILPYLQLMPLDMTACETWFYAAMAGILGMIGLALSTSKLYIKPEWLTLAAIIVIVVLAGRSAIRGLDYSSEYNLALHDIASSSNDYLALGRVSDYYLNHRNYKQAIIYAKRSIDIYPIGTNYNNLGVGLEKTGDYLGAAQAYRNSLKYDDQSAVYENLGVILMVYADPNTTNQFLQKALSIYPNDYKLWVYQAIFEGAIGDTQAAKASIITAARYGSVPPSLYSNILNNRPFKLNLLNKTILVR